MHMLNERTLMKLTTMSAALLLSGTMFSSAMAQESKTDDEPVEYEFRFEVDEDEDEDARDERLEEEVEDYCDNVRAAYYCEDEITRSVQRELNEEDDEQR